MYNLVGTVSVKKNITAEVARASRVGGIPYTGEYEVTPSKILQTLETTGKVMLYDVVVKGIPRADVTNLGGGTTVTIAFD